MIRVEREGPVALAWIERPAVLNALNARTIDELRALVAELDGDPVIRAVILTGSGERAFVAGADISELHALENAVAGAALARNGQALTRALEEMRAITIAAVNGFALGGGCELALACDIRIASERAKFGQPEVNLGLIPGYGGTQRTLRLLGRGQAFYLCATGETIDAAEALRIGLVERVVPPDQLLVEARRIATAIAGKAPLALAALKRTICRGEGLGLEAALELEALAFGSLAGTRDFAEGTAAFLEKRGAPKFTGS